MKKKMRITFNSPVVLWFTIICLLALILNILTGGITNVMFFSVYRSSLLNPLTYIRFFGHVLGHAGWSHLIGNMTMLLVVGPLLEEKYGSKKLITVMLITAFITGLVHFIIFSNTVLLGASGIVFAFILLASVTEIKKGEIPLTLILVAILYIGQEVVSGIFIEDNISNLTHILGGMVGGFSGLIAPAQKRRY